MIYGNCYLLFVICNTKNSFSETVNCQTVTLAIDIGVVQETGTVLAKPIFSGSSDISSDAAVVQCI